MVSPCIILHVLDSNYVSMWACWKYDLWVCYLWYLNSVLKSLHNLVNSKLCLNNFLLWNAKVIQFSILSAYQLIWIWNLENWVVWRYISFISVVKYVLYKGNTIKWVLSHVWAKIVQLLYLGSIRGVFKLAEIYSSKTVIKLILKEG